MVTWINPLHLDWKLFHGHVRGKQNTSFWQSVPVGHMWPFALYICKKVFSLPYWKCHVEHGMENMIFAYFWRICTEVYGLQLMRFFQCNRCTMHMLRFFIFDLTIKCNHFHFTGVATSLSAVVAYWYDISLLPARSMSHLPPAVCDSTFNLSTWNPEIPKDNLGT